MKLVHVLLGADLRASHGGLINQAKDLKIDMTDLKTGEAVVFINRKKNKMKAYSYNGVLSYIRFDDAKRGIDLSAIDEFPRAFNSDGTMDYNKALKKTLEKKLGLRSYGEAEAL